MSREKKGKKRHGAPQADDLTPAQARKRIDSHNRRIIEEMLLKLDQTLPTGTPSGERQRVFEMVRDVAETRAWSYGEGKAV